MTSPMKELTITKLVGSNVIFCTLSPSANTCLSKSLVNVMESRIANDPYSNPTTMWPLSYGPYLIADMWPLDYSKM